METRSGSEKTMVKNGKSKPEPGAEFVVLDESMVKDFKDQTLATSQDRLHYIEKLKKIIEMRFLEH